LRLFNRVQIAAIALLLAAFGYAAAEDAAPTITPDSEAVRQEFLAAMQRVHSRAPESPDSAALIAYPIYDYLLAARFRRDLDAKPGASDALDAKIDTFLQDRPGQAVDHNLRHDWLTSLAVRGRWDWFLPRAADVSDPALVCDRLAGRLATGDTSQLIGDALTLWSQPMRQPHECDVVFAWLRQRSAITPALAESRVRAVLAADSARLARDFIVDVPMPQSMPLTQWLHLLESPRPSLEDLVAHPESPVEPEALSGGFTRLSRTDAVAALSVLPRLLTRPDMTPALQAKLQRLAALGAAYDHNSGALAAFRALPKEAIDGDVQEWRIRAALWAGDFNQALTWIDALPEAMASQPRWRYWRARATEMTLGSAVAGPLYNEIAGTRDYHGYLAADRLHSGYELNDHSSPNDEAAQKTLSLAPGLIRAHELFECDLVDDAALEWAVVFANAENATKVQAAHLASGWGWYAQAITTLVQTGVWDDLALRYPRPWADLVARASSQTQTPGDWIYAVMRQESLFRKDATSRADARGLMQLQPATATAVARRWNLPPPKGNGLFDPAVAIPLGAAYLKELLDHYHSELGLTLAGYNAGPLPVSRWMPAKPIDADIWIENIPYNETRSYVQRVLEHIVAYSRDHTGPTARLSPLLAPVGGPVSPGGDPLAAR